MNTDTKLKNGEIIERLRALEQPLHLKGIKLLYARDLNLKELSRVGKSMEPDVVIPKTKEYEEYEEKFRDLYKASAKVTEDNYRMKIVKDHKGQDISVFDVNETSPEFQKAKAKLEKTYKAAIDVRTDQIKKYNDFLEADCTEEMKLRFISLDEVNPDISEVAFSAISWMIKPETE